LTPGHQVQNVQPEPGVAIRGPRLKTLTALRPFVEADHVERQNVEVHILDFKM
jgi:hypothetical protein